MNAESLLILIFGMVAGGALGWLTAWRFARKIEHHGVKLVTWDRPFDMQAAELPKVIHGSGRPW